MSIIGEAWDQEAWDELNNDTWHYWIMSNEDELVYSIWHTAKTTLEEMLWDAYDNTEDPDSMWGFYNVALADGSPYVCQREVRAICMDINGLGLY